MVLESLVPGLEAAINGEKLPEHVRDISVEGIAHVKLIDAAPIGINIRSTVATYANVHDELRKIYARTADAKKLKYKAGDFSYNTGKLRCRFVMVRVRSVWMCSFCRTWIFLVPNAAVPVIEKKLVRFIMRIKREKNILSRR